jgi:hypothetical protein
VSTPNAGLGMIYILSIPMLSCMAGAMHGLPF